MIQGIDVSKYQGDIDWQAVRNAGVTFAMIRVGYVTNGTMVVDDKFKQNMSGALSAGVNPGVYIYSYATNVEQAKLEAQLLLREIEPYKGQITYPIAWDIEDEKWQGSLSTRVRTDMAKAFADAIEAAGYYVTIYSNLYWIENKLYWSELTAYDMWLAQWTDEPTDQYDYGMWQYTSSGSVAGINGRVDMDYAYKNYPEIMRNAGLNGIEKPQPEQRTYVVQPGDSFWSIAESQMGNGSLYRELAAYNGMTPETVIHPGQVLRIPVDSNVRYILLRPGNWYIRRSPSTSGSIVRVISGNQRIPYYGRSGQWYQVDGGFIGPAAVAE